MRSSLSALGTTVMLGLVAFEFNLLSVCNNLVRREMALMRVTWC